MKIEYRLQIIVFSLFVALSGFIFACADAERDNEYDPESSSYVRAVYVSTSGNDSNPGSMEAPLQTIQAGITKAQQLYGTTSSQVRVAGGTYSGAGPIVTMQNGISIYGGYSTNFSTRNTVTNETFIMDTTASGGSPNRAISCASGFTITTYIDGFTITCGKGTENAGIYCNGTEANLIIQNNNISGRTSSGDAGATAYGIYLNSASVIIQNNTIQPGWNSSAASYGIYCSGSTCTIKNNNIYGGYGGLETYGIWCEASSTPSIINNSNIGGGEGASRYGIFLLNCTPYIENNTFSSTVSAVYFVYESTTNHSSEPLTFTGNHYNTTNGTLYYEALGAISIATGNWSTQTISINNNGTNATLPVLGNTY